MTDRISEKNKQIIAEAFGEALGEQDTKNDFHRHLFGKYITPENNPDDPQDNFSEFQKLREHSQDFRNFAKERFEQEFAQKQTEADSKQNQK